MNTPEGKKIAKKAPESTKPVIINNFVVARPPLRTNFDVADWRSALEFAEMDGGNRVQLYNLYEDVILDPHLSSTWRKRVMNITNTDILFVRDSKEVEDLSDLMDSPEWEDILTEIMNTIAWGITGIEFGTVNSFEMGETVKRLNPFIIPRKHIRPKEGVIVKEEQGGIQGGIKYREGLHTNYIAEIGKDKDFGIFLKAAPYVLLKKGGISDWGLFVQLFGQPFREYTYNGYDEAQRVLLEKSAKEMGSAPYVILPDGTQIKIHDIKTNPSGEVHSKFVEWIDRAISVLVLGNTETTQSSDSSGYAQAETHLKTEQEVYTADKKFVRRVLNRKVLPILYNLGFPVKGGYFIFKEEVKIAERLEKIKLIQQVKSLGAPIDDDYLYEESGIPKPENYEELKKQQEEERLLNIASRIAQTESDDQGQKHSHPSKKLVDGFINKLRIKLADFFDPAP